MTFLASLMTLSVVTHNSHTFQQTDMRAPNKFTRGQIDATNKAFS